MNKTITLAFETSCDETSVAIVKGIDTVLSSKTYTQIATHKNYGGVVPEIASRMHIEVIDEVLKETLREAQMNLKDVDTISVTSGPGLVGALLVGVSYAKALSIATKKPIIAVNHMKGHIASIYISEKIKPPFLALVISGGHTYIIDVLDYNKFIKLGQTQDDAVGEAFDKVARVLGYPYPGGQKIEESALLGEDVYKFPRVFLEKDKFNFSFSGLKTAVINEINKMKMKNIEIDKNNISRSFQEAVIDVLVEKTISAAKKMKRDKIVICGGVSNNNAIFERISNVGEINSIKVFRPKPCYTTDNAAMIGVEGNIEYFYNGASKMDFTADPNLGL